MDIKEYQNMAELEENLWWYRALHEWILSKLGRADLEGRTFLDAGCGSGGFIHILEHAFPTENLIGLDIHPQALAFASTKTAAPLIRGTVDQIPLGTNSVDVVLSIDVLYHKRVDDRQALLEFSRCLKPRGRLILHVPAYQWLYSYHDKFVHAKKRYTAQQLRRELSAAGFVDIISGYRLGLLLPAVAIRRKLFGQPGSDVTQAPILLNKLFYRVAKLEQLLASKGWSIPFGSSAWAIARNP